MPMTVQCFFSFFTRYPLLLGMQIWNRKFPDTLQATPWMHQCLGSPCRINEYQWELNPKPLILSPSSSLNHQDKPVIVECCSLNVLDDLIKYCLNEACYVYPIIWRGFCSRSVWLISRTVLCACDENKYILTFQFLLCVFVNEIQNLQNVAFKSHNTLDRKRRHVEFFMSDLMPFFKSGRKFS